MNDVTDIHNPLPPYAHLFLAVVDQIFVEGLEPTDATYALDLNQSMQYPHQPGVREIPWIFLSRITQQLKESHGPCTLLELIDIRQRIAWIAPEGTRSAPLPDRVQKEFIEIIRDVAKHVGYKALSNLFIDTIEEYNHA